MALRHLTVKKFNDAVRMRIKDKIGMMKFFFLLHAMKIKFKLRMRRFRYHLIDRNKQSLKQSMNFLAIMNEDQYHTEASS